MKISMRTMQQNDDKQKSAVAKFKRSCERANSTGENRTWDKIAAGQNQRSDESITGKFSTFLMQCPEWACIIFVLPYFQVEELQLKSSLISQNPSATKTEASTSFQNPLERFDAASIINEQNLNLNASQTTDPYVEDDEWFGLTTVHQ